MTAHRLALSSLFATLVACSTTPAHGSITQDPPPAATPLAPGPLAGFARMFPGEWIVTFASGTSMFRTWQRGPSQHSLRIVTNGVGAGGDPWRALEVVYWHPERRRVCLLGFSCYARGVEEGEIRFGDETVQFDVDLHQVKARRTLRTVWTFQGPDTYHATLLEQQPGPLADYTMLTEWDVHRRQAPVPPRSLTVDGVNEPSLLLAPLRPLLGSWESRVDAANTNAKPLQSTFEWMPLADVIHARVLGTGQGEHEDVPLLDVFLHHHTGRGTLRCFAISNRGSVHEGDVRVLDGGSLQIELQGHDGAQALAHTVQLDFEAAGAMHCRIWGEGKERRLQLDRRLTKRTGS
jgi:hypothetical protein